MKCEKMMEKKTVRMFTCRNVTRHKNKKGKEIVDKLMMKKKFFASAALAAIIAAQAAMPAMAAYTADNNPYGDQHTTFGVRESDADALPGQVSFQVPLYVTMVARKGQTKMDVPDNYKIQNNAVSSAANLNEIGVVKVTAEHLGSEWSVKEAAAGAKDMTFKMGGLDLAKKLNRKILEIMKQ